MTDLIGLLCDRFPVKPVITVKFRFSKASLLIFPDIHHFPAFLNALGVLPVWRLKYWPKAVGSSKP